MQYDSNLYSTTCQPFREWTTSALLECKKQILASKNCCLADELKSYWSKVFILRFPVVVGVLGDLGGVVGWSETKMCNENNTESIQAVIYFCNNQFSILTCERNSSADGRGRGGWCGGSSHSLAGLPRVPVHTLVAQRTSPLSPCTLTFTWNNHQTSPLKLYSSFCRGVILYYKGSFILERYHFRIYRFFSVLERVSLIPSLISNLVQNIPV